MSLGVIAIGSDNLVRLDQVTNASTGVVVTSGTVTYTLKDAAGTAILSGQAMAYVSNGRFEGTIPASTTTTLTENNLYSIEITCTSAGITLFRKISCIAKYRSTQ